MQALPVHAWCSVSARRRRSGGVTRRRLDASRCAFHGLDQQRRRPDGNAGVAPGHGRVVVGLTLKAPTQVSSRNAPHAGGSDYSPIWGESQMAGSGPGRSRRDVGALLKPSLS